MESVLISPKFQVVIPKKIRELLKLRSGERMILIPYDGRIELVPDRNMKSMKGLLKGMNTDIERERMDRV